MISFSNILFLSEDGPDQTASLERAVTMAENHQAKLTVIDVVQVIDIAPVMEAGSGFSASAPLSEDLQAIVVENRMRTLNELVEPFRERIGIDIDVLVGHKRFIQVIRAILREGYDLLIKPVENPGFLDRLFGGEDMQLLRNCPCPIWLTRAGEKSRYEQILAAVDFDLHIADDVDQDLNWKIMDVSSSLALADFSEMHVAHIWDAPGESSIRLWADNPDEASMAYLKDVRAQHHQAFERLRHEFENRIGEETYEHLSPKLHIRQGEAAKIIPELARQLDADLVVMGTVARTGIAGLLIGNTAETVLQQLQCSVLAVKPPGFVSPVTLPGE